MLKSKPSKQPKKSQQRTTAGQSAIPSTRTMLRALVALVCSVPGGTHQ